MSLANDGAVLSERAKSEKLSNQRMMPIDMAPTDGTRVILAEFKAGAILWRHVGHFDGCWWADDVSNPDNNFVVEPTDFDWLHID